ncbi:hypothetical protein Tco_1532571 [Tanacetum coccineum]
MTTLQLTDTHNLVVFLSKRAESEGFEQIVKTINGEVQLQALVDGKKIIVTEASVRRDLQLNDEEGTDCLSNVSPFWKTYTRKGYEKLHQKLTFLNRAATIATSLDAEQDRGNINKTQSKATLNEPSSLGTSSANTPQSDEDSLKLKELMELYTNLQNRVIDLEKTKTSQAQEITSLKRKESKKRLKQKGGFGCMDASKQGRIANIDADAGINLVSTHFDADTDMFRVHDLVGNEVVVETEVVSKDVNLSVYEVTLAQALAALKSAKHKADKEQAPTLTVSSQQPSQLNVQDKGKGKMVEPEPVKKFSKKDQLMLEKELAFKLQAELEEEDRLVRQREEANIVSWDNVQEMIDADYQMAQQMQAEEQEKLSIEEKSKLFVQLLEARNKHFAAMRAQEKRNNPPTKDQKRNIMSTYLKNMAGYKQNQLKNKSFDDIQKLFDKAIKRVNLWTWIQNWWKEVKQKVDEDKETSELQRLIEVVPDKEEVAIDAIPLTTKPPSIVDYKMPKKMKSDILLPMLWCLVMVLVMIGVIKQKKVQQILHSWLTLLQVLTLSEDFMPLKPNLSFSILEEFTSAPIVIKPVVKNSEAKASEEKPKAVRKNNGAPITKL